MRVSLADVALDLALSLSTFAQKKHPNNEASFTAEQLKQRAIHDRAVEAVIWGIQNDLAAYSLNNITSKNSSDGSVTIQFGGCAGKIPNCLPIVPGWN